jgi:hypothetical protein
MPARSRTLPALALGCLTIASLPFIGAGILIMREGWSRQTDVPTFNKVVLPLIGLAFALFGLTFTAIGVYVYRSWKKTEGLRERHPGQPWMWREDWAAGHIADNSLAETAGLWIFAILWNLISWAVAVAFGPQLRHPESKVLYVVLLFPAIGVLLLFAATRAAMRRQKFGNSICRPSQMPVCPGTPVRFGVQLRLGVPPEHGMLFKLTCLRRVTTGSGKSSSTTETVLWQDEQRIDSGAIAPGPSGSEANVVFRLPGDAPQTDPRDPRNQILWRLTAAAEVPGVDYAAGFEVPVYGVAPPIDAEEERELAAEREQQPFDPAELRGITLAYTPDGGEEIRFAAGRSRSLASALTLFAIIFGGCAVIVVKVEAPIVFAVVFTLITLLLFVAAWDAWFATTRVVASREGLRITRGRLLFERDSNVLGPDVLSIAPKVMASSSSGDTTEAIYSLEVATRSGRKLTAGTYIPSMRAAEFLAGRLRAAVGLAPHS